MPRDVSMMTTQLRTDSPQDSRFYGRRVHFIGIGGSGMNGLARVLIDAGAIVSGSEPKPNQQTFDLTKRGAKISRDQIGELLSKDVDLVVRTAAVPDTNQEFVAARALGIRTIKYAQLLGEVMAERCGIAICGTHGKSTTTAMTSYAMLTCGIDPSFVIGGTVPQLGGGSRSGKSDKFVVEACEFDRSFHNLSPRVAVITNIEADHLDCYKDLDDIIGSFKKFASLVPQDGLIIANGTDVNVAKTLVGITAPIEYAALKTGFAWSTRATGLENGCYTGEVSHHGKVVATLKLSVPGEHNLINATMALAACVYAGLDPQTAADALGKFTGVDRRMTHVGTFNGATVIDDYGHHPTEIRATLKALRERFAPKRLICVFQPHQYSRTRLLLEEFATCFVSADVTIVPDIYAVRDTDADKLAVSSKVLVARVNKAGQQAIHIPGFDAIVEHLRRDTQPGDLIVTMGAGTIWEVGRELVGN